MNESDLRIAMCEVGHRLWLMKLVGGASGNLSCRISPEWILCTPRGVGKGHLRPEDLVVITKEGSVVEGGVPSSEIKMHLRIYANRPDCSAVVHAHPPIATAMTLSLKTIPEDLLPESMVTLGRIATIPFCMPGTNEVPDAIEPLLPQHKTFLLSHHGAVTLGQDLESAYHRMETLERVAETYLYALTLGSAHAIPREAFEKLNHHLNSGL